MFLPHHIKTPNCREQLEKRPDPVHDIVLPDVEDAEANILPSWCL
jgi:hypothetical protein